MKKYLHFALIILAGLIFVLPNFIAAREADEITDWYIKDFASRIELREDSTMTVVEKITADCDNLTGKHGIFRILPEFYMYDGKKVKTPVKLKSITDFNGALYQYKETRSNSTVTWKIGDPDKTVVGENNYQITYEVKNVMRFNDAEFDEFYWNLNGNFWDIETDNFLSQIIFPPSIGENQADVWIYGPDNEKLTYAWDKNVLSVKSPRPLDEREGLTASVAVSKGIFTPYEFSFMELYGLWLWLLIPIFVFIYCLIIWLKYGNDPGIRASIVPEFGVPENLPPLSMGVFISQGSLNTRYVTAEIINLATHGYIKIEELESETRGVKNYELTRIKPNIQELTASQQDLIKALFISKEKIKLSDLKDSFSQKTTEIEKLVKEELIAKNYFHKKSFGWQSAFTILGIIILIVAIPLAFAFNSWMTALVVGLSGGILWFFGSLMPKLTPGGESLNRKIKGFHLYMNTAEKYRQQFNDKENILERFLPYAVMWGMTKVWIEKMKDIYGEKYVASYHPVWFVGTNPSAGFNAKSFSDNMVSLSNTIATTTAATHSSSGSGGGGFSGGGGGGGGGGGW